MYSRHKFERDVCNEILSLFPFTSTTTALCRYILYRTSSRVGPDIRFVSLYKYYYCSLQMYPIPYLQQGRTRYPVFYIQYLTRYQIHYPAYWISKAVYPEEYLFRYPVSGAIFDQVSRRPDIRSSIEPRYPSLVSFGFLRRGRLHIKG